ncbi:hypothetical protein D9M71_654220 [compost metagenome]
MLGVRLNVLNRQLHMPWRDQRSRLPQGLGEIMRPGFQHCVQQHLSQPRWHQCSGVDQHIELGAGGQIDQCLEALENRDLQINHRLEHQPFNNWLAQ